MSDTLQIIEDLYASEINYRIDTFWDTGYTVLIGDELNEFKNCDEAATFTEAIERLRDMAVNRFPDSEFAKKYK